MKGNKIHTDRTRSRLYLSTIALLAVAAYILYFPAQAQETPGCNLSNLGIDANIPAGYTRKPTKCPMVVYTRNLSQNHAQGFYITKMAYPYNSSDKKSPNETVNDYITVVQSMFNKSHKGQNFYTKRLDEHADYPPSIINHGGACGGLVAKTPISHHGLEGVQWRRGIMCLIELPPKGADKWVMIQAFFFDMNLENADYRPTKAFDQAARQLFRSIRIKGE